MKRSALFALTLLVFLFFTVSCNDICPQGKAKNDVGTCVPSSAFSDRSKGDKPGAKEGQIPPATEPAIYDYSWEAERFSWGQRSLVSRQNDPFMADGIKLFIAGKFEEARDKFNKSAENNKREPEPLIYKNNSMVRAKGKESFRIAAVVPISDNEDNATEILRGIAQAQEEFNNLGGANGRLLEVIIADDGLINATREQKNAVVGNVAKQLVDDPSILGVVGHNSSEASKTAIETYEPANLAIVSPTSTSTSLKSEVFFRIPPSDKVSAQKLACYVKRKLNNKKAKVVVFFDSGSNYSVSFKKEFRFYFPEENADKDMISQDFDARKEINENVHKNKVDFAVLIPSTDSYPLAIDLARLNKDLGDDSTSLLGGDSLYGKAKLESGAESLNGLIIPVAWFADSVSSEGFYQKGLRQWGWGRINWRTAMSYDATVAFISSFQSGAESRQDIVQNLSNVSLSSDKTSGEDLRFNPDRERLLEPVLIKIESDKGLSSEAEPKYVLTNENIEIGDCF